MTRFPLAIALSFAMSGSAVAATYSASLAQPVSNRFITRDISWQCSGSDCRGATTYGRPVVLCQSLAKKAGLINRFTVDGRDLSKTDLQQCNALAKPRPEAVAEAR